VEENEFRKTYEELRELPCAFEKALLSRHCDCAKVTRFNLGDREGVACSLWTSQQNCAKLLGLLRENARFALQTRALPGPLPHARELRVQAGGLKGLQSLITAADPAVADVSGLVQALQGCFGSLDRVPFEGAIRSISAFEVPRRGRPRGG
jgi:hypothetical protein